MNQQNSIILLCIYFSILLLGNCKCEREKSPDLQLRKSAQDFLSYTDAELFPFTHQKKHGFTNLQGEWVIEPQFETAFPFIEGIALVKKDGKHQLIDRQLKPVPLPENATGVSTFKSGLAPVLIAGKVGFINRKGELVVEPLIVSETANVPLPQEGMRLVSVSGYYTFIDSTGKQISKPVFAYAQHFSEGLAVVMNENRKYGYIDKTGNLVIPFQFDEAQSFSDGLALTGIGHGDHSHFSLIDKSGKVVFNVPDAHTIISSFQGGKAPFRVKTKDGIRYGFYNKKGEIEIQPEYDWVESIVGGSGETLGKAIGVRIKKGELFGLIDGEIFIEPKFNNIKSFHEGLAAASTGTGQEQRFGYIDKSGNWKIQPAYYAANDFSSGLAAVCDVESKKWGYIDESGKIVIEPQFNFVYNFNGDIAIASKERNRKVMIDRGGNILMEE